MRVKNKNCFITETEILNCKTVNHFIIFKKRIAIDSMEIL